MSQITIDGDDIDMISVDGLDMNSTREDIKIDGTFVWSPYTIDTNRDQYAEQVPDFALGNDPSTIRGHDISPAIDRWSLLDNDGDVYEYEASSVWDIGNATFLSSYDIGVGTDADGLEFSPSTVTKAYTVDNDQLVEFDLGFSRTFSSGFTEANRFTLDEVWHDDLKWKEDGTKVFTANGSGILEYDASTAWDTTTLSLTNKRSWQDISFSGRVLLSFSPNGKYMHISSNVDDTIQQHELSTAWDTTTIDEQNYIEWAPDSSPAAMTWPEQNGSKLFVATASSLGLYE